MYIVQTCMYTFIRLCTHFEFYEHVRTMYKPVYWVLCSSCWVHWLLHTFHVMYRHCWTGYVHCWTGYVQCWTGFVQDAAFCFAPFAGLLAGTACCLVSCLIKFNHTSSIGISLRPCQHPFWHPLPPAPCRPRSCPQSWGPVDASPRRVRMPRRRARLAGWRGWRQ